MVVGVYHTQQNSIPPSGIGLSVSLSQIPKLVSLFQKPVLLSNPIFLRTTRAYQDINCCCIKNDDTPNKPSQVLSLPI